MKKSMRAAFLGFATLLMVSTSQAVVFTNCEVTLQANVGRPRPIVIKLQADRSSTKSAAAFLAIFDPDRGVQKFNFQCKINDHGRNPGESLDCFGRNGSIDDDLYIIVHSISDKTTTANLVSTSLGIYDVKLTCTNVF